MNRDKHDITKIKARLRELSALINETEDRLPAHSTKPPTMLELLAYEDEYDELTLKLKQMKNR